MQYFKCAGLLFIAYIFIYYVCVFILLFCADMNILLITHLILVDFKTQTSFLKECLDYLLVQPRKYKHAVTLWKPFQMRPNLKKILPVRKLFI